MTAIAGSDRPAPVVGAARVFAAGVRGGILLVHDPASGLTHAGGRDVGEGRVRLGEREVTSWPVVAPSAVDTAMPISACWSPVVRCNLACPHCLDDKAVRELPSPERTRIADVLGSSGLLGIDISGGEPLLLPGLEDLTGRLTAGGVVVSMTTNGWHLARRAETLAGRVDAVRVSIDGPDPRHHDRWRGPGSFDRAVEGVHAAVACGLPVQLQCVLMRSTAPQAQGLVDLAASLGARGVTFLQMLPIGEGVAVAETELLDDSAAVALVDDLEVPERVSVRLRTRGAAGSFTVVRADGRVWRNTQNVEGIVTLGPLDGPCDLAVTGRDGSA